MKQKTAKPSESAMRFFTPELYLQINSTDENIADEADRAWEAAVQAYQQHLNKVRRGLPESVRELTELCLHDAELIEFRSVEELSCFTPSHPQDSVPTAMASLVVKQGDQLLILNYLLWDRVQNHAARTEWPFSVSKKHWLYDEVDWNSTDLPQLLLHRILFSDGAVIEIPFLSATIIRFNLQSANAAALSRTSA